MSDIHALSGAFAVDALDDVERKHFEQHLAACPECRAEVRSFTETAAMLTQAEAVTPPSSLRTQVMTGISMVRPFPPEVAADEAARPVAPVVTLRRRLLPTLVAAAAVLVLVTAGAFAWHPWRSDRTTVADQIRNAPDAVTVAEKVPGGGTLTIYRSASLHQAVMVSSHVGDPASGKTYQLWFKQPGQGLVSAGLMPDPDEPTVLTGDAATATAAAVSVEPSGGSPQPTTQPVAVFPLKTSAKGNGRA